MKFDKLENLLDNLPNCGIPACDLAVTKNGELIFRHCAGYSSLETHRKASPNDLYWIFSATKVITCTAAMRLIEEGKLNLDDPVSKYIPEFETLYIQTRLQLSIKSRKQTEIVNFSPDGRLRL